MERGLKNHLLKDLRRKIVLLSGPRQCGKTTLSKSLTNSFDYLNFDVIEQRKLFLRKTWDRDKELVIFDELHKMKNWKSWLKGVYDSEGVQPQIIVTGSAKLDTYKKVGDSLAGRFFSYRLHPLDIKEIVTFDVKSQPDNVLSRILEVSGFPEPYLDGRIGEYNRWRKSHVDIILRQDLIGLETVHSITQIETLIELMRERVGNPLSHSSLAEDLQCSDKTVKRWLGLLENLYVLFKITPYHKNVARSLLKRPKYYFYDTAGVQSDEGIRFENAVACALLKEIQFREDALGQAYALHYLQNKEKKEIDFLILKDRKPHMMIEAKISDATPSSNWSAYETIFPGISRIQLVKNLTKNTSYPSGLRVKKAADWLAKMEF